mmetsp:Transcript_89079/g.172550  ORF Transcript_89079/g.172550 Transcript_89079/m.172550 type:complete len:364 (+) Transcript_89079:177-1268(+)
MSGDTVRRAATHGQVDWLKRLFASGANPCETDDVGLTPLHLATLNGHADAVECCAINDRGVDPSGQRAWALQQQTSQGWSALHIAAEEGKNSVECVRVLLSMGCDPWLLDVTGKTAGDLAQELFDRTGSAISELVVRLLKNSVPSEAAISKRRLEAKDKHWAQQVRRGNTANIGDFPTPKEHRAPIIPTELKVAEWWHVTFSAENFQAPRGAYGRQSVRNLVEACAEAEANAARRFELAHSRQLAAEYVGKMDFRTPPEQRTEATAIAWEGPHLRDKQSAANRHLRGHHNTDDEAAKLHLGYAPFKHAAMSEAVSAAQKKMQRTRTDPYPPYDVYAVRPFKSYAFKKWKTIEFGPELFGTDRS